MLVLSRKKNEKVIIDLVGLLEELGAGDYANEKGIDPLITLDVVEIRGDKVRQGITADRRIAVHREEVYNVIHNIKETPA